MAMSQWFVQPELGLAGDLHETVLALESRVNIIYLRISLMDSALFLIFLFVIFYHLLFSKKLIHQMYSQIPLATLFAVLATASPTRDFHLKPYLSARSDAGTVRAAAVEITSAQILAIAPTSSTCDNPPAEGECATADQAAPYISDSFTTYGVDNVAEQAALIGLMAFETLDFKYNRNHFPGVAGQGSMFPLFHCLLSICFQIIESTPR